MTIPPTADPMQRKPLRLWPGAVAVLLQWLAWLAAPAVLPEAGGTAVLAGLAGGLAVVVWWLFFSRAPWLERVGALALMIVSVIATKSLVHPSVANGMMGMMLPVYAVPVLSLALVASLVASRRLGSGPRRAAVVAGILLGCGAFTLLRTGGITGDAASDLHWRWTQTAEERLLAETANEPAEPPSAPAAAATPTPLPSQAGEPTTAPASPLSAAESREKRAPAPTGDEVTARSAALAHVETDAEWPGFRGPARDAVVHGVRIETDWSRTPPVELWRRAIGPGWSSFAVRGDLVYTQEQRGEEEVVSCYRLTTGEPVWMHRDRVRFWESNGGAGPRATPTLGYQRVYTLGATGVLNALDARDGSVVWSRNAAADTGTTVPGWGFASSPLVIDDLVVAAMAGQLVAYDVATGETRWSGPAGGGGYSSPHLATIGGVAQVLLLRGSRTTSVAPRDGALLWEHVAEPAVSIVQPALTADGGVLVAPADAMGGIAMRRLAVAHGPGGWTAEERWTSKGLKPYFNDFVVHAGHAFGFDGSILACIDLEDGKRNWKGGRYGHGQLILLADQDLLLVLSEEGELALVRATPDEFTEMARFPALEGKTWNHPALVGDLLLVRNGEQMAAFRLPRAEE